MPQLSKKDINELLQHIDSQVKLSQGYDSSSNREMAYLALWAALEFSVKRIHSRFKGLAEHPMSLPREKDFKGCLSNFSLGKCGLWDLMDSKKKYRRRRNEIAHAAAPFGKEDTYREYLNTVQGVIAIFRGCLERQLLKSKP